MRRPRVGLLPLYIDLYDQAMPELRGRMDTFYGQIAAELGKQDLEVISVPICRIKEEFRAAVQTFENSQADCIVTLHLAYSPSLESADILASTKLPIIVLDTTPISDYGPSQDPNELMYNHGIHGVQDMCNLLVRNRKDFWIEAGHWQESDLLKRVAQWARASHAAAGMRSARIGIIGRPFPGMGDFAVPFDVLRSTIGIEVVQADLAEIGTLLPSYHDPIVNEEMSADLQKFSAESLNADLHRTTTCAGIAVRRWIEKEALSGFAANFLAIGKSSGIPVFPFLEASKAMARGIGYAGEGDVLTAALVGALAATYSETTFTEMFCPDWKNNSIFLSHMGEMNIDLVAGKAKLLEKSFPWTDAENPVIAVGRFKEGQAVLVSLAPYPDDTYALIVSPVEMLGLFGEDRMGNSIRGWFRPGMPIADFLSAYSRAGGTHHLAMVYGVESEEIYRFGEIMGWKTICIG